MVLSGNEIMKTTADSLQLAVYDGHEWKASNDRYHDDKKL